MKLKKNRILIYSAFLVLFSFATSCKEDDSQEDIVEDEEVVDDEVYEGNGLVIVELESAKSGLAQWEKGNTEVDGKRISYIYAGVESLNVPGKQPLNFPIEIGVAGTYKFVWHCKVGEGNLTSEENDTWLKIDADNFYGERKSDGATVRPHGVCDDDCPAGTGSGGWFKVYSNVTTDWSWRTKTNDGSAFEIYATFNIPGIYNVTVSARSAHQFLDRFVLYHLDIYTEGEATNLSKPATH